LILSPLADAAPGTGTRRREPRTSRTGPRRRAVATEQTATRPAAVWRHRPGPGKL